MSDRIGFRLSLGLVLGYAFAGAVLIAALVFAVEPLSVVWLTRTHFPGFDLSVPRGGGELAAMAYPVGRFDASQTDRIARGSVAVFVRWDPHESKLDDLTSRFEASARSQGGTSVRTDLSLPDGKRAPLWHMRVGADVWITTVSCGQRTIRITTSASVRGSERLHRRIVTSLRCHPDPAAEGTVGEVPVVLHLPPGYTRSASPLGQVVLTSDRKMVMAEVVAGHLSPEAGAKEMESGGALGPGVHLGAREGTQWAFESEGADGPLFGWATTLDCRDAGLSVWLMAASRISRDDAREGQEILRQARCRAPAEPAQAWPR